MIKFNSFPCRFASSIGAIFYRVNPNKNSQWRKMLERHQREVETVRTSYPKAFVASDNHGGVN